MGSDLLKTIILIIQKVREMLFEEFQVGYHLGDLLGIILTILNFQISLMPDIKFWLNMVQEISKM